MLFPSLSKFWASTTVTIVYTYAGEIFPTVLRGFAIGASCTVSQIGLALTPYILYLVSVAVAILIFGEPRSDKVRYLSSHTMHSKHGFFQGTLHGKVVPFLILGVFSMLAAFLLLTLPETLNQPLPTTMHESEHYAEFVKKKGKESRNIHVVADPSEAHAVL